MKTPFRIISFLLSISALPALASQVNPPAPKATALTAMPAGFVPPKAGTRVFFANLKDHQTISKKQLVKFGVEGMQVAPAGTVTAGTGHHHLIIDGGPVPATQVIPNDATHLHFGKGQTETELELAPGPHKLTLQFADGAHRSYGPEASSTIDVVVK